MKTKIVGGVLIAAALSAGASTPAMAGYDTDTCTHSSKYPSSGHRGVRYVSYWTNSAGQHMHKYTHDVAWMSDHNADKKC